jgi:tetratricopeptide (TPR) repeat protein
MINLLIAIGSAVFALLLFGFGIGGGEFRFWYGFVPALLVLVGVYFFLARWVFKQVEAVMLRAQGELAGLQDDMAKIQEEARSPKVMTRPSAQKELQARWEHSMKERFDRAIEVFKTGYRWSRWQFLIQGQISGQIGMLYYLRQEFDKAEPYLKESYAKLWIARAMLAVHHFRRKEYDKSKAEFETAVKSNKGEAMLWSIYAWCLWKNQDRDGAIKVLGRAQQEGVKHELILAQHLALQNNQKMQMEGWGEQWYQFHLAKPPTPDAQQAQEPMKLPTMGKISRRYTYR